MKKLKYLGLVLCLSLIPIFSVKADELDSIEESKVLDKFNIVAGENVDESNEVNGSSITAGDRVNANNTVKGIDMVLGNNVSYAGNSDYSLVAGNSVNIKGTTLNDGFIFGNIINFDKEYVNSRDLTIFGNIITLKGEMKRDVIIFGSDVILDDVKISGNIRISAANITIKEAQIDGTLSYNEDAKINISSSANINEKTTFEVNDVEVKNSISDTIMGDIVSYGGALLVFAALSLLLPGMFNKIENKLENATVINYVSMLGYGLLYLIAVPIAVILLFMTVIGIPLALLSLIIYVLVLCFSSVFTGYLVGLLVWNKFIKKEKNMLLIGLIGISIVKVLTFIPYIDGFAAIISILLALSIFSKLFSKDA